MASNVAENNKRIAKNTIMLYFRQFLIMLITLYTSRVILQALGVEDYGIYNVVGGVISMLGILNGFMGTATSRYLNFALGKNDEELLKKTFSISLQIYVVICLIFLIISETIGLWFLNTKLVIPENRIVAANWIYQFAILSCINTLLASPFNAAIISHERMNVYAYVSILEVLLKLVIVYALLVIPYDSLITYGLLLFLSSFLITMVYRIYCIRKFPECHFHIYRDKVFMKQMLSYSVWNLLGTTSNMVKGQGLNILLNMFFNPSVNAARGIAYQINTAIVQFSNNFYTAVRPQITKYYAKGEMDNMFNLVFRSSKMTFYLILLMSLPIVIEAPFIINFWLGQEPEHVVIFVRLIVIISAIDGMAHPLMTTAQATGRIALYQTTGAIITIMNIPVSYVLLKFGAPPVTVFVVSSILTTLCLFNRLWMLKRLVDFPVWLYVKNVFFICLIVSLTSAVLPVALYFFLEDNTTNAILTCCVTLMSTLFAIYVFGFQSDERMYVKDLVNKKILKR